jgi:hypothetical protein
MEILVLAAEGAVVVELEFFLALVVKVAMVLL